MAVDFESATSDYSDWTFTNFTTQQTNTSVTAYGGNYFGTTGGKTTGSLQTKDKVNPSSITFYYSKTTNNTTASYWKVQVSTDGSKWTDVSQKSAAANVEKGTWYAYEENLSAYSDVYVRIYYDGTSAVRCLDDVVLTTSGGGKTLTSIAVSGTPTKTSYYAGDDFDPAGLTVTGTYSDATSGPISSGITWTYNPSQTLVKDQTSIGVIATVSEIASPQYNVTGLSVTAASSKITITQNEVTDFTNTYAEYSWTAAGVSGKMYAFKNSGMQFNSKKTGYYVYNTDPIPGRITKITMIQASGTAQNWTPYVSTTAMTSASGTALDAKSVTTSGASWDVTGSNRYFYLTVAGGSTVIGSIVIEYTEEAPPAVEAPSISGDENFVTSTTVTISHAEADHIYYTTNGDDPTTSSTEYTAPFELNATATVKAIAVKGSDESAVAEKTFTKIEPDYTTIAAFLTDQPNTDKYIQFAGNVVVTGVNGKNVFIQDESGNAICLYFAANSTWTKGHKVTGMFQAKYASYGNMPEMSITDGNEGTIAATETAALPDPIEITSLEKATINANMCKYVVLKGVYFQGQSLTNKTVNLQDASSNVLKFYDNLSLTDGKVLPLTATACDVTGVLISYKSGKDNINEILPVDVACINAGAAALPTLSTAGSTDEEHPTMVANGESITITPAEGFTSTLNAAPLNAATNISITETESNTVIAVSASRDYYATANATYYFKANPAGTKYAITVVQPEQGGTLEANFAETEAGNPVTLTATPTNSHFTFDGWVVKKTGEPEAIPETVTENQFSMPEYNVTVTGSFTEEGKATLTFAKGVATGTEDAPANIENYAGEVTLPACPFTYAGHYFIGWKKGETEDIYQPGAYTITAADVTARTITFTAQWAAGSIFEWVAGDHKYTNGQGIGLVNSEPIKIEFATGSKYYTSDQTARFYTAGTLTITAPTDYVISKIEFSTTEWGATANKETLDGNTWTGLAEEVIFTATVTCKVKSLKVYYKEGAASTLEIDDIEMAYGDVVTISPKTVTPETATSHVSYEIKAGSDDCITLLGDQITAKSVTGTATIVATIPDAEGGEYLGTSVEFTVRVSAPDSRYKAEITSLTSTSGTIVTVKEGTHKDKEYISYAAYQGYGTTPPAAADGVLKIYKPSTGKSTGGYVVISAVKGCIIDEVQVTNADSKATTIGCSTTSTLATTGTEYAKAATVAFTNLNSSIVYIDDIGGERADITKITVYYTGEPVALHHLKLSGDYPTEFEQGAAFSHEGLVVTACYDEGETDIEVVTASATISTPNMNAAGQQTITVSFGGKTAEYTITINAAAGTDDLTGTWNLVTDAADLMAGMKVIIAQHVESDGAIYTMGDQKTNNRDAVASTVAGTRLVPNFRTRVFVLEDAGNGMFALKSEENGKYLCAAASNSNNLKSQDDVDDNAKWTISINEGVASIVATNSSNRNVMQFNSSLFSCYGSASQAAIALYARPFDYSRNVSGNYATICLPKAGQIIGATLYEIAYYGETSKKIFFDEIVNGEMEAGIPYIFQPAAGVEKINVYYSDNTAEDVVAGNRNGLIGFYNLNDPEATHNITQDAGYYILYNNQYWLVSGRAAYVENYRAYIQLDQIDPSEPTLAPGRRRISMSVNDTQTTTGFENAEANEAPRKVLINGELFILRGEKMYDAKGQLVK